MFGRLKIRRADSLFSQYLRKKRNYTCEKCGRRHDPNSQGLGVSHFWVRAKESVRFDEENCDILCNIPCHSYFESHKTEYHEWKRNRMGKRAFDLLMVRAHTPGKRDDKLQIMLLKKLMKEQKSEMHDL